MHIAQKEQEISTILQNAGCPELADRLNKVPSKNISAIYEMVTDMRQHNQPMEKIRFDVVHDVAGILRGEAFLPKSDKYMPANKPIKVVSEMDLMEG